MSIAEQVEHLVAKGKLIHRPSSFMGISARNMVLLPDIDALARAPFADTEDGERHGALSAYLDAFSELNRITVSQNPNSKPSDVMLARVRPVEAEFWSMRVLDPEGTPGMRLLGAFYGLDSFVGLIAGFREEMTPFDHEVSDLQAIWYDHFGNLGPHSGRDISEYITNYREY